MKVVIDKNIPFLEGVVDRYAQVVFLAPEQICAASVRDADALIVRTRTKCDAHLLEGSQVRFIATATIGYDHIDTAYCERKEIYWTACPGCNAMAVCDYVEEALAECAPQAQSIGVIGVGNVGGRVVEMAQKRGMEVRMYDPPKGIDTNIDEIAEKCDVITFHTPLVATGPYPTYHLAGEDFIMRTKPDVLIINAARGGVVDEAALLRWNRACVIDCWEGEPELNMELVARSKRATCHIAGYSLEGKMNASQMCLDAFSHFFSLPALKIDKKAVPLHGDSAYGWLKRLSDEVKERPMSFEQIRKNYTLR